MKTLIVLCFSLSLIGCSDMPSDQKSSSDFKYFETKLSEAKSPNGKRNLQLGEIGNDSTNWTTQVLVDFKGCGGGVYAVGGRNLGIQTFWKGNDTIIIKTKGSYRPFQKHDWMQCFLEKIKVVYIEN